MRKRQFLIALLIGLAIFMVSCSKEDKSLEDALLKKKESDIVRLDSLTDFQWNSVYFVKPYTEKSEIEKYIGISSDEIYDNISDEGTLYMIFTLDDKVVYQIYGNPNNLGFDFDVGEYDKIKNISKEKSVFNVKRDGKIIIYKIKL
ncbi:hypothetical protein [Eubacterium sp.]|uniref:hypothetical protein n=1 Tax=Eubacterium sp. TaxID=142586 RepID=UPI003522A650